jgi:hypothetical protein
MSVDKKRRGLKTNDTMYSISFTDTSSHHGSFHFHHPPFKNAAGEYTGGMNYDPNLCALGN